MAALRYLRVAAWSILPTVGMFSTFVSSAAQAASGGQPLILDTQRGISDGQSGTVLQTAPLVKAPIVAPQPIAEPAQLAPSGQSIPLYVAPYISVGGPQQQTVAPGATTPATPTHPSHPVHIQPGPPRIVPQQ
ncbi:hypothetical protein [Paraburkholderia kururiensis]|uniref:Uncharacterized protein n=1 Tax=Paraburkholderia kururiensis TaxID=984307 RepID=A0ABZ0WT81_9BURK|nr:hypothetical protein [Paraburkholderia kururiensis]WQD80623.1 hypothetical protein U0042_13565 [Paraburkholderia kururiensis]